MKNKASKKNRNTVVLLVAVLLAGLSLLLYPAVSNYWNSLHQSQAIATYMDDVSELDDSTYHALWKEAQDYNTSLLEDENRFFPDEEEQQQYEQLLSISDDGIIGYIEIPSIDVTLPIYHGTSEEILQTAIGHIEGSSLPVGGPSTHCVISGHRGLPSSKLFTDIDQLSEGDIFTLSVLEETLTYEVDQIRIVEPDDISLLGIEEGEDLCTLVSSTPYGVNSHRLLVRGHRVENREAAGHPADHGGRHDGRFPFCGTDPRGSHSVCNCPAYGAAAVKKKKGKSGKRRERGDRRMKAQNILKQLRTLVLAFLLGAFCMATTAFASVSIETERNGSLSVHFGENGIGFSEVAFSLYRVADILEDGHLRAVRRLRAVSGQPGGSGQFRLEGIGADAGCLCCP